MSDNEQPMVDQQQIMKAVEPYMHDVPREKVMTKGAFDMTKFFEVLEQQRISEEEELLKQIFGENEVEEGSEDHYDDVMSQAGDLFLRQLKAGDAYAFHKAFEKAYAECKEHGMLP